MTSFRKLAAVSTAAGILGLAALAGPAQSGPPHPPPGVTYWYSDEAMTNLIGYSIVECDGTRHGPYGSFGPYELWVPHIC